MDPSKCKATSKQSKRRCGNWPVKGALVCAKHGGKAPQVASKAAVRVADAEARRTFGKLAEVSIPVDNPFAALAVLAGEVTAWKNFIAGRIAELDELRYEGFGSGEQLNAEIALFERALDRCVATMTSIARLNLDEKSIRVSEHQTSLLERAMLLAFADIGLTEGQQEEAQTHVGRHLRALATG